VVVKQSVEYKRFRNRKAARMTPDCGVVVSISKGSVDLCTMQGAQFSNHRIFAHYPYSSGLILFFIISETLIFLRYLYVIE
jgi:hypothetical protein